MHDLFLLSIYLKKWSYGDKKITFNYSFTVAGQYERFFVEMRVTPPANMGNELLSSVYYRAKDRLINQKDMELAPEETVQINMVNEAEIKRKIGVYITKILKEFNNNRKSQGKSRMITSRSLDFFYNDFEFEPLSDEIKFFIHLNRGMNKLSGELWEPAIEDLKQALKYRPEDIRVHQSLSLAYKNLGNFERAHEHSEYILTNDPNANNRINLARSYISMNAFSKAEGVLAELPEEEKNTREALLTRAQLYYKTGQNYQEILDLLLNEDADWLSEQMNSNWDFKLAENGINDITLWNAGTAARYLGIDRPFELTRRAFNEHIPCYFDSEAGIIRFSRWEIDSWIAIKAKYSLEGMHYKTYQENLRPEEILKAEGKIAPAKKIVVPENPESE